jgi:DnaJ-class molecular chaperone
MDLNDLFSQFFQGASQAQVDPDFGAGRRANRQERRRARAQEPVESKVRASDGSWLTVKGSDVHSDLRLPFQDAILGTVRELATIDGTSSMKIPPGTSSGQKLRLRGKGIASGRAEPGDHYVTVHIDIPRNLDDDAKRKLVELIALLDRPRTR